MKYHFVLSGAQRSKKSCAFGRYRERRIVFKECTEEKREVLLGLCFFGRWLCLVCSPKGIFASLKMFGAQEVQAVETLRDKESDHTTRLSET